MGELVEVFRTMRRIGPTTLRQASLAAGLDSKTVQAAFAALRRAGLASERKDERGRYRVALQTVATVEAAHVAYRQWAEAELNRPRSLPLMQRGPGIKRDDCASYLECVDVFAHAHSEGVDAHCPKACASFERDDTGWKRTAHDAVSRRPSW